MFLPSTCINYKITWRHSPEDHNPDTDNSENFKPFIQRKRFAVNYFDGARNWLGTEASIMIQTADTRISTAILFFV
jgi:hypothetical protein